MRSKKKYTQPKKTSIKNKLYICNPWENKSLMCQASPILGYDNYSKCITECPKEINKLWFCLSTTYKLLFPKKFTNKQYIDTYWSLKKYALTLQKMALKKKNYSIRNFNRFI